MDAKMAQVHSARELADAWEADGIADWDVRDLRAFANRRELELSVGHEHVTITGKPSEHWTVSNSLRARIVNYLETHEGTDQQGLSEALGVRLLLVCEEVVAMSLDGMLGSP